MEKWAKAMNAQKDAQKEEQRKNTMAAGRKESAAADAGFAILQKSVSAATPAVDQAGQVVSTILLKESEKSVSANQEQ